MNDTDSAANSGLKPLTVYIENAARPELGSATLPLPITAEELRPWLEGLELDPQTGRGIAVKDIRTPFQGLGPALLGAGAAFEELNYLAVNVAQMSGADRAIFAALTESDMCNGDAATLINATLNMSAFDLQPAYSTAQYGAFLAETGLERFADTLNQLEQNGNGEEREMAVFMDRLTQYVDFQKFGEWAVRQEGGVFTDEGYLTVCRTAPETYRSAADMPAELRLFSSVDVNRDGREEPPEREEGVVTADVLNIAAATGALRKELEPYFTEPDFIIAAEYAYYGEDGERLTVTATFPASEETVQGIADKINLAEYYEAGMEPVYIEGRITGLDELLSDLDGDISPEELNGLATRISKLDSLSQGVLYDVVGLLRANDVENFTYMLDALSDVTKRGAELSELREQVNAKRLVEGYEVIQSVRIDGQEIIVGENLNAADSYLLWHRSLGDEFGFESHMIPVYNSDYTAIMREFATWVSAGVGRLELDRVYRGSFLSDPPLDAKSCVAGGMNESCEGKVIVVKQEALLPDHRSGSHQLYLATGGNGCSPTARGQSVFCTNLYNGDTIAFRRHEVLGVMDERHLPTWACDKLAKLREGQERETPSIPSGEALAGRGVADRDRPIGSQAGPPQFESVLAKIEEGRARQKQQKEQRRQEQQEECGTRQDQQPPDKRRNKHKGESEL